MKKIRSTFCRFSSNALLISVCMMGVGMTSKANAQDVNGIFFPRSSEEFFRAGVERLEHEVINLQRTYADSGDRESILDIDESVSTQQDELEQRYHWLIDQEIMPESFNNDAQLHAI